MPANLKLVFGGADKDVSMSFSPANPAAAPALVKTLMEQIVASGDIYAEAPLTLKSADFHVNTVMPIDIS